MINSRLKVILQSSVFKNGFLFSSFSFLNSGFSFILLLVLARFLTVSDYGQLNLYNILVSLVGFTISLSTNGYLSVIFFTHNKSYVSKIINIIILVSISTFILYFIIILLFPNVTKFIGISLKEVLLSLTICLLQVFSMTILEIWRLEEKIISYGIFSCLSVLLNVSLTLLLIIVFNYGWEARAYAQLAVGMIAFVFSVVLLYNKGYLMFHKIYKSDIEKVLSFGVPLIPHSISTWIRQGFDRYIINSYFPIAMVGVYSLSFNIANLIHVVGFAFNATNSVYIYKLLAEDKENASKRLYKQTKLMVYFFLILTISTIVGGYYFIPVFFPKYDVSLSCLVPLCMSAMLQCIYYLFVNYIFYFQKTKRLMFITLSVSVLHLLLSILFTRYSLIIAAYINLFSNAIITFLVVAYSQKLYSFRSLISIKI